MVLALVSLLVLSTAAASAAWTDQVSVAGNASTSMSIAAPSLSCVPQSLTRARIQWPVQSTGVPAAPTYTATITGGTLPAPTVAGGTAYVDVTSAVFSSLIAGTKTVTVSGSLAGWTGPSANTNVTLVLIGLLVSCGP